MARIIPFGAAMLSLAMAVAFFFGLPTATSVTVFMFLPPIVFLAMRKRWAITFGFLCVAVACVGSAIAAWFVPNLTTGQRIRSTAVWVFLAWNFTLAARMVVARGVKDRGVRR